MNNIFRKRSSLSGIIQRYLRIPGHNQINFSVFIKIYRCNITNTVSIEIIINGINMAKVTVSQSCQEIQPIPISH